MCEESIATHQTHDRDGCRAPSTVYTDSHHLCAAFARMLARALALVSASLLLVPSARAGLFGFGSGAEPGGAALAAVGADREIPTLLQQLQARKAESTILRDAAERQVGGPCYAQAMSELTSASCQSMGAGASWRLAFRLTVCHLQATGKTGYDCAAADSESMCVAPFREDVVVYGAYTTWKAGVIEACGALSSTAINLATAEAVNALYTASVESAQVLQLLQGSQAQLIASQQTHADAESQRFTQSSQSMQHLDEQLSLSKQQLATSTAELGATLATTDELTRDLSSKVSATSRRVVALEKLSVESMDELNSITTAMDDKLRKGQALSTELLQTANFQKDALAALQADAASLRASTRESLKAGGLLLAQQKSLLVLSQEHDGRTKQMLKASSDNEAQLLEYATAAKAAAMDLESVQRRLVASQTRALDTLSAAEAGQAKLVAGQEKMMSLSLQAEAQAEQTMHAFNDSLRDATDRLEGTLAAEMSGIFAEIFGVSEGLFQLQSGLFYACAVIATVVGTSATSTSSARFSVLCLLSTQLGVEWILVPGYLERQEHIWMLRKLALLASGLTIAWHRFHHFDTLQRTLDLLEENGTLLKSVASQQIDIQAFHRVITNLVGSASPAELLRLEAAPKQRGKSPPPSARAKSPEPTSARGRSHGPSSRSPKAQRGRSPSAARKAVAKKTAVKPRTRSRVRR